MRMDGEANSTFLDEHGNGGGETDDQDNHGDADNDDDDNDDEDEKLSGGYDMHFVVLRTLRGFRVYSSHKLAIYAFSCCWLYKRLNHFNPTNLAIS